MGATFLLRMQEDTGRTPGEVAKAYTITREALDARELWAQIDALDGKVAGIRADRCAAGDLVAAAFVHALAVVATGRHPGHRHGGRSCHDGFRDIRAGENILPASQRPGYEASIREWNAKGVPADLGLQLAALPYLEPCPDIIEVARERKLRPIDVAKVHFRLGDALNVPWLQAQIDALPVEGRWHAVARGVLRDELAAQQRALVQQVLAMPGEQRRCEGPPLAGARRRFAALHAGDAGRTGGAEDAGLPDGIGRGAAPVAVGVARMRAAGPFVPPAGEGRAWRCMGG